VARSSVMRARAPSSMAEDEMVWLVEYFAGED